MATVAEQLHAAREAKKLSINQIAETTKIRSDHIRALETGDFDVFTAPVYIRGFVRTYATLLKLDVPKVMAELDTELGQTEKFREPPSLTGQPRSVLDYITLQLSKLNRQRALAVLGGGMLVCALAVVFWVSWNHRSADPLSNLPPAVYQSTQHQSGDTLPLPDATPRKQ